MAVRIDKSKMTKLFAWVKKATGDEMTVPTRDQVTAIHPKTGEPLKFEPVECEVRKLAVIRQTEKTAGEVWVHFTDYGTRKIGGLTNAQIDEILEALGYDVERLPIGLGGARPGTVEAEPGAMVDLGAEPLPEKPKKRRTVKAKKDE